MYMVSNDHGGIFTGNKHIGKRNIPRENTQLSRAYGVSHLHVMVLGNGHFPLLWVPKGKSLEMMILPACCVLEDPLSEKSFEVTARPSPKKLSLSPQKLGIFVGAVITLWLFYLVHVHLCSFIFRTNKDPNWRFLTHHFIRSCSFPSRISCTLRELANRL